MTEQAFELIRHAVLGILVFVMEFRDAFSHMARHYPNVLGAIVVGTLLYSGWRLNRYFRDTEGRRLRMHAREREAEVMAKIADEVAEALDNLLLAEEITGEEHLKWTRRIGRNAGLHDLLPRGTLTLKEQIKQRFTALMSAKKLPLQELDDKVSASAPMPKNKLAKLLVSQ